MKIDKDIDIPMRDGADLRADVLRPESSSPVPTIMSSKYIKKTRFGFRLTILRKLRTPTWCGKLQIRCGGSRTDTP